MERLSEAELAGLGVCVCVCVCEKEVPVGGGKGRGHGGEPGLRQEGGGWVGVK